MTALVNDAQKDLRSALIQIAKGLGTANQLIEIAVTSRPAGADVILNGALHKTTPCNIRVAPGVLHDIEIVLPGHETYKRQIRVEPGMKIDANLVPRG